MLITLRESVELWEIATENEGVTYLDDCDILADIGVRELWDFLMFQFEDMGVIDSNSQRFHERVKNFFAIHKWNIEELYKTLNYEYEPLENNKWAKTENAVGTEDEVKNKYDDNDRTYNEQGSNSGTDVNLVSAYNDETSPEYLGLDGNGNPIWQYNDEEHDRQTHSKSYNFSGSEDNNRHVTEANGVKTTDDKDTVMHGNDGLTFQQLISEQRESVQFNIYKWIANHFCRELLVAVW